MHQIWCIFMYAIAGSNIDIGNERETVFYTLARVTEPVTTSSVSDFQIGDYTFEVGGRKKGRKQIEELRNGIVVKDGIEFFFPIIDGSLQYQGYMYELSL